MGVGDVRGVRNFSRFPTPGHPFYLAHHEVDHEARGDRWKRSDDDDEGRREEALSLFLHLPISHRWQRERLPAGWCPATVEEETREG